MTDFALVGIPIAAVIVALVELAKRQGLEAKYAPVLAVIIGLLTGALVQLSKDPAVASWVDSLLNGLLAGLAASGLYSGGKAVAGK